MDEKIRHQLRIKNIRAIKNPTIFMNSDDFNSFKLELETTIQNFKVGENPQYGALPVKTSDLIQRGSIVVYDDVFT